MRRTGIRYRRTLTVAVALCTSAFIGLVAATPAQAAPPGDHQNFFPNDIDGLLNSGAAETIFLDEWLSDLEDGQGEGAHLTVVATPDTSIVIWYFCPTGVNDGEGVTTGTEVIQMELNTCAEIGRDDTPTTPNAPGAGFPPPTADEAYETEYNIPTGQDDDTQDIVSLACTSTPASQGTAISGGNCRSEAEADIYLEDAQTGAAPQTQAAEWDYWCPEGCDLDPTPITDQVFPFIHGDNWPADGTAADDVEVAATTNPDGTGFDDVEGHIYATVDGVTEYVAGAADDSDDDTSPDFVGATFNRFDDINLNVPATDEMSVVLADEDDGYTSDAGKNTCNADATEQCAFDAHYVVSLTPATDQVHIHNDELPHDPDDGTDDGDTFCEDEGREKDGTIETFDRVELYICSFNQFTSFSDLDGDGDQEKDTSQDMDEDSTIELSGAGGGTFDDDLVDEPADPIDACPGGTVHDHDGDGLFEHCHRSFTGFSDAYFVATANGAVNVLACDDPDQGDDTNPDHGCADAPAQLTDTLTKTAGAGFDHAHLRFKEDLPGSPPCHTGATAKDKAAGSPVNLTGCVQDQGHNGAADVTTIWRILSGPGNFVSTEQTTDSAGQADAVLTAPSATDGQVTTVQFCTDGAGGQPDNGVCDAEEIAPFFVCPACRAQIQISWTKAAVPGGSCPQTGGYKKDVGTKGDDKLKGDAGCNKLKGKKGNDLLRGKGEDDLLVGGSGFDRCYGGPGDDRFKGCEKIKKGSQTEVV